METRRDGCGHGSDGSRRRWFAVVTALVVVATVELLAAATGRLIYGPTFHERPALPGAMRLAGPSSGAGALPTWLGAYRLHPFLGFVANPTSEEARAHRDVIEITPLGFYRFRDDPQPRGPNRFRLGVFGGSVATLFTVMARHRLRAALEQRGFAQGQRLAIEPYTLPGFKQPQQLFTLAYLLAMGEHLDLVVNLDGFNEIALSIAENARSGVPPLYPRSWTRFTASTLDIAQLAAIGRITIYRRWRHHLARAFGGPIVGRSATSTLLWRTLDAQLARAIDAKRQAAEDVGNNGAAFGGDSTDAIHADDALIAEMADAWYRTSLAMHALCRAHGIRYVHVLQPNQYLPDSKPMRAEERRVAFRDDHPFRPLVEVGYPLLRAHGQQLVAAGVEFHDLSTIFAGVTEQIYIDECCHFNKRGNDLLAEALVQLLENRS